MRRFLATLVILVPVLAVAQTPLVRDTITVSGTGHTTVVPDRVSFTVGVETVAETVDAAVNDNNTRAAAIISALKRGGAADTDIRTANFSVWPRQDNRPDATGQPPRITGYQVTSSIIVRRSSPADAGRLLQAAINAGANTASGLSFEVSDPTRGRDQGLRAAFDDARAIATLLAQAAGRTLGPAIDIAEGVASAPPVPRVMAMRAQAVSAPVPVEAGTQENIYNVTVVFELR